jgi:hypothetical protein
VPRKKAAAPWPLGGPDQRPDKERAGYTLKQTIRAKVETKAGTVLWSPCGASTAAFAPPLSTSGWRSWAAVGHVFKDGDGYRLTSG